MIFAMFGKKLQWGRNFIVAEMRARVPARMCRFCRFNGAATLSLRKWIRAAYTVYHGTHASMGPQLYRCGNSQGWRDTYEGKHTLQWGRNFIVAEILAEALSAIVKEMLQWGRNFIVAEILSCCALHIPLSTCFNGAATLSLRRRHLGADNRF